MLPSATSRSHSAAAGAEMAEQIKIRTQQQGDITEIRVLMQHPMENGMRKGEDGQVVPAHFIQLFSLSHNGKPLIEGQLNTSISKNPLFMFKARGMKAGDKLLVAWTDNKGLKRQDEVAVG